jgi:hypothetical protein
MSTETQCLEYAANVRAAPSWSLTQNCASGSSISPAGGQSALPENPPAAQKANGSVPNIPRRRSCGAGGSGHLARLLLP